MPDQRPPLQELPHLSKMADISLRLPEEDVEYILDASRKYHYSAGYIVREIIRERRRPDISSARSFVSIEETGKRKERRKLQMPETRKMVDISLRMPEEDVKYILEASRKYGYSTGAIVHEIIREHIKRREKEQAEK